MSKRKLVSNVKLIALIFAGPAIFVALIPWLDEQPDFIVYLAAALATLWALSLSLVVSVRFDKAADEWERSGSRFSYFWGGITGGALVALLLALPPFHTLIVRVAAWSQGLNVTEIDRTTVIVVFTAGFATVLLAQTLCSLVFLLIWRRRTLRAPE